MLCVEVFSGTPFHWIVQPWGRAPVIPALPRTPSFLPGPPPVFPEDNASRTLSPGVLFALYESRITKVTWAGYMNQPVQSQDGSVRPDPVPGSNRPLSTRDDSVPAMNASRPGHPGGCIVADP